jgi:hypothetical protein
VEAASRKKGGEGENLENNGQWKPEFTSLEKMGFVMGGASGPADFARRTADNTQRMVGLLEQLTDKPDPGESHQLV